MIFKLAVANVRRSYRDFAIYFVTLLTGVAVFYAFNSIGAQQAMLNLNQDQSTMLGMLGMLIGLVSALIVAILAFLVIYASRFLIRRRNKEFGLYLLLGMPRHTLLALTAAETLIVGVVSLTAGLVLGILISQGLLWATSLLFEADMSSNFTFLFAPEVALNTVLVFLAIFAVSLVANVGHVARARLIDLINADRKNEVLTLRSIPLSIFLFVVACASLACAYELLLENGLLSMNFCFLLSTALMVFGTFLFFYSLSGFLLRVLQIARPVYYRGLNMFVVRQVASRINASFASMGVICITLFFALTSVCGGIGICAAVQSGYDAQTRYDATVTTYALEQSDGTAEGDRVVAALDRYGTDMETGLSDSFARTGQSWDALVRASAEIDYRTSDVTYGDLDALSGHKLSDFNGSVEGYEDQPVSLVSASQYNHALELAGAQPLDVPAGQVVLSTDMDVSRPYLEALAQAGGTLDVGGVPLSVANWVATDCIETTTTASQAGALIVNDDDLAKMSDLPIWRMVLDVQLVSESAESDWNEAIISVSDSKEADLWPVAMSQTRQSVYSQNVGIMTIISYLAIYIGFVLVVACAAILAIQQLTGASDNRGRYRLLDKLGATRRMIDGALAKQIAVAFVFPLLLAVCHSVCALIVVMQVVELFGHVDIAVPALVTAVGFVAVYGAYFALTYVQARRAAR